MLIYRGLQDTFIPNLIRNLETNIFFPICIEFIDEYSIEGGREHCYQYLSGEGGTTDITAVGLLYHLTVVAVLRHDHMLNHASRRFDLWS